MACLCQNRHPPDLSLGALIASTTPAIEWGTITGITWDESYGLRTPPDDDAPSPKPTVVSFRPNNVAEG